MREVRKDRKERGEAEQEEVRGKGRRDGIAIMVIEFFVLHCRYSYENKYTAVYSMLKLFKGPL